jgi:hypothetical protein
VRPHPQTPNTPSAKTTQLQVSATQLGRAESRGVSTGAGFQDLTQTILLVDMYGYTQIDAAEILGCAEGTIKSRLSRARRALAEDLGHLRPFMTAGKLESFREGTEDE